MNDMELDGIEYRVGTDEEATEAAHEAITESLWAFNADFLASHLNCPVESVQVIQSNDKCEDNNETFKNWLGDGLEDFCDDAISADGRGHFLNSYDGNETEFNFDGTTYYAYRSC